MSDDSEHPTEPLADVQTGAPVRISRIPVSVTTASSSSVPVISASSSATPHSNPSSNSDNSHTSNTAKDAVKPSDSAHSSRTSTPVKNADRNSDLHGRASPVRVPGGRLSPIRSPFDLSNSPEAAGMERLQKMILAHEIAMNDQFRLQNVVSPPPANTLEAHIRDTIHQAFWDALQTSLADEPPNYSHSMTLLSFLPRSQNSPLRELIQSNLDMLHIRQRADIGMLDIREVAVFIIDTMGKLCAPARDDEIKQLYSIEDTVSLFRQVFHVLEEMKFDMLNFTLTQVKPLINQHAVEYEQQMFDEFLATQPEPLFLTKEWLRQTALELLQQPEMPSPTASNTPSSAQTMWKVTPTRLLRTAFVNLLDTRMEIWPETLVADISRIDACQLQCEIALLTAGIVLVTWTSMGNFLNQIPDFKPHLKDHVKVLLETHPIRDENVLALVAEHVIEEIRKTLKPEVLEQKECMASMDGLKSQIVALAEKENSVRQLLVKRLKDFTAAVLTNTARGIPPGLMTVEEEVTHSVGMFARIVSRNQMVFGKHYTKIISSLADELGLRNAPASPNKTS